MRARIPSGEGGRGTTLAANVFNPLTACSPFPSPTIPLATPLAVMDELPDRCYLSGYLMAKLDSISRGGKLVFPHAPPPTPPPLPVFPTCPQAELLRRQWWQRLSRKMMIAIDWPPSKVTTDWFKITAVRSFLFTVDSTCSVTSLPDAPLMVKQWSWLHLVGSWWCSPLRLVALVIKTQFAWF